MLRRSARILLVFTLLSFAAPRAQADIGGLVRAIMLGVVVGGGLALGPLVYDGYAAATDTTQPLAWGVVEGVLGLGGLAGGSALAIEGVGPLAFLALGLGGFYLVHGIRVIADQPGPIPPEYAALARPSGAAPRVLADLPEASSTASWAFRF